MKVEIIKQDKNKLFKDLKPGDVFIYKKDNIYLKTENDSFGKNAVNVKTGVLASFVSGCEVEYIDNAKLVIE